MTTPNGRAFEPSLTAVLHAQGDLLTLACPGVGLLRNLPPVGTLVAPGDTVGLLDVLGVLHRVVAPAKTRGVVCDNDVPRQRPVALQYGQTLLVLDPKATASSVDAEALADDNASSAELVFRSPLSGRFYARPSPDKPNFVAVGDIIQHGQTVALLEVMKTFNRITYGGEGLPAQAKVIAIAPADEDDLEQGAPILELEPA